MSLVPADKINDRAALGMIEYLKTNLPNPKQMTFSESFNVTMRFITVCQDDLCLHKTAETLVMLLSLMNYKGSRRNH